MQSTPVSVQASEQLVHGVPVSYISGVASRAAAVVHHAAVTPTHEVQRADPSSHVSDECPDS
jgi:hypothetical protein